MRIWGFDLGTTSVGFAVIDQDKNIRSIRHLGVRIFPEGVTEDKGEPRNKQRRDKRMMRRQLRRKRWRRIALHEAMAQAGLLPASDPKQWPADFTKSDPYDLRDKGLSEKLEPHQIGRALFHMLKRRGFKSARLASSEKPDDKKKQEEDGVIAAEIKKIQADLDERSLGQWLKAQPKRRGHHTARGMTDDEFQLFWKKQAEHHRALLTDSLKRALHETAFAQKPIFWRLKTLGECSLMPGEPLCPKGSWLGQRFVMLQTLNNLRLAGGNARELDADERTLLLAALENEASLTFPAARKLLKALWQKNGTSIKTKFNLETDGSIKQLPGNKIEAELANVYGNAWRDHPRRDEIRRKLFEALWAVNYRRIGDKRVEIRGDKEVAEQRAQFITHAQSEWRASAEQAEALAKIEPPAAWLALSSAAIEKLMPHLEAGLPYVKAKAAAFPNLSEARKVAEKLSSDPNDLPVQRNPTVARTLNEFRKVVNNLLRVYGKPDLIRIELARDVALIGKNRKNYIETLRYREALRKRGAKELKAGLGREPTDRDIQKWLLWQECGETCPYTLDRISFGDLFGAHPKYDIEHIWPRSVVLDDALANKTLCRRDVNLKKHQRLPIELYKAGGHGIADLPDWEEVSAHVKSLVGPGKFTEAKARRFLREQPLTAEDRSEERLIGDTAYIAREARLWLASLMPQGDDEGRSKVETRNGRLVSRLRKLWHLNELLGPDGEKNRNDHRHHALDAAVVALFGTAAMQQLIRWFKDKENDPERKPPPIDMPWLELREDLRAALDKIIVSHKVRRKVNGPLHDETRLGLTDEPQITEGGKTYNFFVKRKALNGMSKSEIAAIRDVRIRALAEERLAEHGGDAKAAFVQPLMLPDKTAEGGFRPVKRTRIVIKLQPDLAVKLNRGKAYAEAGDNHHIAIYRRPDGKIIYRTINRVEAARRVSTKLPIVEKNGPDGSALIFTLCPGATLAIPNAEGSIDYRVVTSVWASGQIVLIDHRTADGKVWSRPTAPSLVSMNPQKVSVDPIGRVRPAKD